MSVVIKQACTHLNEYAMKMMLTILVTMIGLSLSGTNEHYYKLTVNVPDALTSISQHSNAQLLP